MDPFDISLNEDILSIYSVDCTEARRKTKKIQHQNIAEAGFDLRPSDFPVLHSTAVLGHNVSHRHLNPHSHALLTPTKSVKSKNQ